MAKNKYDELTLLLNNYNAHLDDLDDQIAGCDKKILKDLKKQRKRLVKIIAKVQKQLNNFN